MQMGHVISRSKMRKSEPSILYVCLGESELNNWISRFQIFFRKWPIQTGVKGASLQKQAIGAISLLRILTCHTVLSCKILDPYSHHLDCPRSICSDWKGAHLGKFMLTIKILTNSLKLLWCFVCLQAYLYIHVKAFDLCWCPIGNFQLKLSLLQGESICFCLKQSLVHGAKCEWASKLGFILHSCDWNKVLRPFYDIIRMYMPGRNWWPGDLEQN